MTKPTGPVTVEEWRAAMNPQRPMPTEPPDRLALDPKSQFHNLELLNRGVGVRFKGFEITNVAEYCVSEGWVRRIPAGGSYRNTIKLQGAVEVWFRQ